MNKEEITEIIRKLSYTGYTEQDIKSEAIRIIENLQIQLEVTNEIITMNINRINKLENENQQLKKQKADVVEYIKKNLIVGSILDGKKTYVLNDYNFDYKDLLRMLGEIDG